MTATAVKERPWIAYAHEVRAILEGRQTQFRRVVKLPGSHSQWTFSECFESLEGSNDYLAAFFTRGDSALIKCPYGKPGDLLWVRETWAPAKFPSYANFVYRADWPNTSEIPLDAEGNNTITVDRWVPSIHMPREVCRLTLDVARVWIEQVQDVSEKDAISEGVASSTPCGGCGQARWDNCLGCLHQWGDTPVSVFQCLWDSINKVGNAWDANPWVWCVEFKVLMPLESRQ